MDIVERLRDPEQGFTSSDRFHLHKEAADEIERLRHVLDAARLVLKNRDQRPNEMKVYEAIRVVLGDWRPS